MKIRRAIRRVGESFLICAASLVLPLLPRLWIVGLARGCGNAAFRAAGKLRRIAAANLDVAFGATRTEAEKLTICRDAFQTFALVVLDLFWFSAFTKRRLGRYVKFDASFEHYFRAGAVIAVTGHLGNWEVMGQAAGVRGAPSVSVAAPLDNDFADHILNRRRRLTGQRIVERQGAVRGLVRALRAGGKVALLMDQNTVPAEGGCFVEFFNLPVPISRAAAALSLKLGAPLVPTFCVARPGGRYEAYALAPLGGPGCGESEERLTSRIAEALESEIRRHPGQWLWMYKRWRFIPADEESERYPFYARPLRAQEMAG